MKLMVLISYMHRTDTGIISESNVQTDSVVVNQCDRDSIEDFDFKNKKGRTCHVKFIDTTERGLSNSRNLFDACGDKINVEKGAYFENGGDFNRFWKWDWGEL